MDNRDILVSICCVAYNHEKFIRKALEGFVNQKTNFNYEVLVHDDASTDGTAAIIKKFEEKYPSIIRPVYQRENQYQNGGRIIARFLLPKAKGKYIAFCEGDDFWTDSNKLQMQVEALEKNIRCSVCFNLVELTDIEGKGRGYVLPMKNRFAKGVISSAEYLAFVAFPGVFQCMSFQLSGCMVRRQCLQEFYEEDPAFRHAFDVGDLPLFLYMGLKGDAYYIDACMSCYRTQNPNSWAGRIRESVDKEVSHYEREGNGLREFDCYSNYIVHEFIEKGIRNRKFIILRCKHDVAGMKTGEMRELYYHLSLKSRIAHNVFHIFPKSEKIWTGIKTKKWILRWRDKKERRIIERYTCAETLGDCIGK